MKNLFAAIALIIGMIAPVAASAQTITEETVIEEEYINGQWVEVSRTVTEYVTQDAAPVQDVPAAQVLSITLPVNSAPANYQYAAYQPDLSHNSRYAPTHGLNIAQAAPARPGQVQFGPFRVIDGTTVEMNGIVDGTTPQAFASLLKSYPGIKMLVMVDCPGSYDDAANLRLARMVHAQGIATHVPANGSVRSGAVELFLAGVHRSAAKSAEFAVHSWRDQDGTEAYMLPLNHPVHQEYLGFYRDVGIDAQTALSFYSMTNSVPFSQAIWLKTKDIARYGLIDEVRS